MIKKLLNFGKIDRKEDKYFGELEINYDKTEDIFYLEKEVKLNGFTDSIYLMIASKDKEVTKAQFELFELIKLNFSVIVDTSYDFMNVQLNGQQDEIREKYKVESVMIGEDKSSAANWELDLINTVDGFSHCLIEFEGLNPKYLSIEG